jgi:hypothetical protein
VFGITFFPFYFRYLSLFANKDQPSVRQLKKQTAGGYKILFEVLNNLRVAGRRSSRLKAAPTPLLLIAGF